VPEVKIVMVASGPMEFYPNRIVAHIHEAMKEMPWYRSLTEFTVDGVDYLKDAPDIAAEIYQDQSHAKGPVNADKLVLRVAELERMLDERTDAFFKVWKECERLRKEQRGGV
jgi:hypothetical protein